MIKLLGKLVNVVLTVDQGRGVGLLKKPSFISASFNDRVLESNPLDPEETCFNTELVWEIEKKDLKKIFKSNTQIRVEWLCSEQNGKVDQIGFILLGLKGAQVVSQNESLNNVKFKWCELIGRQGFKKFGRPELYLSLTIRDDSFFEELPSKTKSPHSVTYHENGCIQIGNSEEASFFQLIFLIKTINNLNLLLPEVLEEFQDPYCLSLNIFGVEISTKPLKGSLQKNIDLNEEIVINLKSSQRILKEFFETESIKVNFFSGPNDLGMTTIELYDLSFKEKTESTCFFKNSSSNGIIPEEMAPNMILDKSLIFKETFKAAGDFNVVLTPVLRKFILNVSLKNFAWKESCLENTLFFKFLHPQANKSVMVETSLEGQDAIVELEDVDFSLSYFATEQNFLNLVHSLPPKLVIKNSLQEDLSRQNFNTRILKGLEEGSYNMQVYSVGAQELIASIVVSMSLKEDLQEESGRRHLSPVVADKELYVFHLEEPLLVRLQLENQELKDENRNLKELLEKQLEESELNVKSLLIKLDAKSLMVDLQKLQEKFCKVQSMKDGIK